MFINWIVRCMALGLACMGLVVGLAHADVRQNLNVEAGSLVDALEVLAKQFGVYVMYPGEQLAGFKTTGVKGTLGASEAFRKLIEGTPLVVKEEGGGIVVSLPNVSSSAPLDSEGDSRRSSRRCAGSSGDRLDSATAVGRAGSNGEGGCWDGESTDNLALARVVIQPVQTGDGESSSNSDLTGKAKIEEIVVTATKREERLIDVPQAMSVLSADHLAKLGAIQLRDFADTVPGLSFQTEGAGLTQITLRGVTAGKDVGATVGIYVDEVPYGSSTSFARGSHATLDAALFDLERIEVLRGPQGTLYGASTMGGLLKYVTKRPDATRFGIDAQTGVSSTHGGGVSYHGAATANVPIAENTIALRLTGFYSRDAGYIDNLALNKEDINHSDIHGGRAELLFTPNEALSIRITGFLQDIDRDGFPLAHFTRAGVPIDGDLEQRVLVDELFEQRFRLGSATVSYDVGPAILTSISSYQTARGQYSSDQSPLTFLCPLVNLTCNTVTLSDLTSTDKFTQEVRLASEGTRVLEWLIGAFYTQERSIQRQGLDPSELLSGGTGGGSLYKEYAAFGDLTWHLTGKLDMTGGVRYARNSTEVSSATSTGLLGGTTPRIYAKDDAFTYLANARYHFSDNATGYLRYATGYRPGGPNLAVNDPITGLPLVGPTFGPDELKSYEVGFKADSDDRRFGIDAAVYYIDWRDIQVLTIRGGFGVKVNAPGGASIRGSELTLIARPTSQFTATSALAYQDAKLSEAESGLSAAKGERLPTVPRFTAALNADYELSMGTLQPTVGGTFRYVGDRTGSFGTSAYRLPEYTTVDLRAGLTLGRVDAQLHLRNLFDERGQLTARVRGTNSTSPTARYPISIIQPRTIGLTLSTKF